MRLPITDKFLLDLFNLIQKIDRASEKFIPPRTMKELLYPDIYKLRRKYERENAKRKFSQFINYLKEKGYIKIKNLQASQGVLLTKKGIKKILKIKFKFKEKKRRKDGKWLMIIFDIPERKRDLRHFLREFLLSSGFIMLKKSVWVCPYDVLEELEDFLQAYSLDRYVKIFLIEEAEI